MSHVRMRPILIVTRRAVLDLCTWRAIDLSGHTWPTIRAWWRIIFMRGRVGKS